MDFIIENENRKGALYKADNWTFVGKTSGSTKMHLHGISKSFERQKNVKKLVFCKWIKGGELPKEYHSTWDNIIEGRKPFMLTSSLQGALL